MNWKKAFLTLIISLTFLVVLTMGCNKAETPTPEPSGSQQPDTTQQVSYVGDNACKSCHTESYNDVTHSNHYKAFKPLSDFSLAEPLGEVTIFDPSNKENPASTTLNFTNAKVYGVMQDSYVIAEVPPTNGGFENKIYRVGTLKKTDDKWAMGPAKKVDINKDGKDDWTAENYTCGKCHSPGIETGSPNFGISCESCHGPGGNHVAATDKTLISSEVARDSCNICHESNPSKNAEGVITVNNHYGARNFNASKHAQSKQMTQCLACHSYHKVNANGSSLLADKPTDVCVSCHAGIKFDLEKLMWTNPTDLRGQYSKDHSFGVFKYEDLGDDPATKPVEVTNPATIELMKKHFPNLAK